MDKEIWWLSASKPKTPPVGERARQEMGALLRLLQRGEKLSLPHSRPMTQAIGRRCHELRVRDGETGLTWRLVYRVDAHAIVVAHWWAKKTERTAKTDLDLCRKRFALYDLGRTKEKR